MIIDKKDNILTYSELKNMPTEDIIINVNATKALTKRIEYLVKSLENMHEYQETNKKYNFYVEEIIKLLSDNQKDLLIKLDDYYTETLILHNEYFYKNGYIDGINRNRILRKPILWIKVILDKLSKKY